MDLGPKRPLGRDLPDNLRHTTVVGLSDDSNTIPEINKNSGDLR